MDSISAFIMGQATRGRERMVFDWDRAARHIVENRVEDASAGLSGDWEYTGGPILADGKIVEEDETYTFLASTWAVPELIADGRVIECFVMESQTEWDQNTYWPQSARDILESK